MNSYEEKIERYIRWALFSSIVGTSLVFIWNVNDSTFLKLPLVFIFSLALLAFLLSVAFTKQKIQVSLSLIHIIFEGYIAASGVSLLHAANISLGLESLLQLICYFVVFSASAQYLTHGKIFQQTIFVLLIVTGLTCAVPVVTSTITAFSGEPTYFQELQISSTLGNRSYFAGFLIMMAPIVLSQILATKNYPVRQVLLSVLGLVMLYLIIKTGSRSAWVALTLSSLLMVILNFKLSRTRWLALGSVVIIVILTVIIFGDVLKQRLSTILDFGPQSTIARRYFFYAGAWRAFLDSPVIGHGVGNYRAFLPKFRSSEYWMVRSEDIVPHAHNEYLEILSETGIVGFLFFGGILFLYLKAVRHALKETNGHNRTILVGLLSSIAVTLIDNLASINLRTVPVALLFWMIIGISFRFVSTKNYTFSMNLPKQLSKLRYLPVFIFSVWLVSYIPHLVNGYVAEQNFLEGILLRWQNNIEASSIKLRQVILKNPNHAEARLYLASSLAQQASYKEAYDHVNLLLKKNPYYPKARIIKAICLFEFGDTSNAFNQLNEELRIESSPQVFYYASYFAYRLNQKDREYEFIKTLLTKNIQSGFTDYASEGIQRFTELCSAQTRKKECLELLRTISQKFSTDSQLLSVIGESYEQLGSLRDAAATYELVLTLDPNNKEIESRLRNIKQSAYGQKSK
ncbi:MAG: O-antigen ligase family protein [Ignavibacteriae bacterium]|nr:O-antigen ligase family protein [Ignavibacteriota bacterium]